jgi:hypothetical protein
LKVEKFAYEEAKPENDGVIFGLIKGGLRSITGLLGKRNHERFVLNTPTATIGIRGTTFIAEYMPENPTTAAAYARSATAALDSTYLSMSATRSDAPMTIAPIEFAPAGKFQPLYLAQNTPPGVTGALAPGLYVHVIDGIINLSNKGGSQSFSAGQFGFTGSFVQPPVILPNNPGLKFSPPPSFSSTTSSQ